MKNLFPLLLNSYQPPFHWVTKGVAGLQIILVNVYFIRQVKDGQMHWFLVDAGLGRCALRIKKAAEFLFGTGTKPEAILLTHGHFDHIGGLASLAREWDVPVYAHPLEMPYLTGQSSYPPPDPSVGGGSLAALSSFYPKSPIKLDAQLLPYPADGCIPGLDDWQVIPTPGHSPGHVSFFRESDRTLIAGDAIVTVKQASFRAVVKQQRRVHGPPAYFTCDWQAAQDSVATLARLEPEIAACGHGRPMRGAPLREQLTHLSHHFEELATPHHGRYVHHPAQANETGVVQVPPALPASKSTQIGVAGLAALAGFSLAWCGKKWVKNRSFK